MADVILSMLPMMLGAMLAPAWIILVLLMMQGQRGLANGAAFIAGPTIVRLLQGVLFGLLFGASSTAQESDGSPSKSVFSTLVLVVGILLLITAVKTFLTDEDPDAPPPKWISALSSTTPLKAFGIGAGLAIVAPKLWIFTLATIGVIQEAQLSTSESVVAYLIYILGAQLLILLPVIAYAVAPKQSASTLQAATTWLEKQNRLITIVVSLLFGVIFLWKGVSGLMG